MMLMIRWLWRISDDDNSVCRLQRIQRSAFRSLTNLIKLDLRWDQDHHLCVCILCTVYCILRNLTNLIKNKDKDKISIMITWEPLPLFPSAFLIGDYVFSHNSLKFIPGYSFSHIPQLRLLSRSPKPLLRPPPRFSSSNNNLLSITTITTIQSHHCPFSPCKTGIWICRTKKYKNAKIQIYKNTKIQ